MSRKGGAKAGRNSSGGRQSEKAALQMRIIGGRFRGRHIAYDGDRRTRPMKDRVREAVFNLVGPAVKDKLVLDLFAGTGAMSLEAISRGARSAIAVECSFPAVAVIRENAMSLGAQDAIEVARADVFHWCRDTTPNQESPWLVFCCPPYALYTDQEAEMVGLVERLMRLAPPSSLIVLEFDANFPADKLPNPGMWDVRTYSPAVIALYEHPAN